MSHEGLGSLPVDVEARIVLLAGAIDEWQALTGEPVSREELLLIFELLEVPKPRHIERVSAARRGQAEGR